MVTKTIYQGVSPLSVFGIVLVTLKLTGTISLDWVWVLAPFWVPLALFSVFAVFMMIAISVEAIRK